MKRLAIIGSTGSVGTQTLDVIRNNKDKFDVKVLIANSNSDVLAQQIKEFSPQYVGVNDEFAYSKMKGEFSSIYGKNQLIQLLDVEIDLVVIACSGISAIPYVLKAIENKIDIALSNKECLVCCGELIMRLAKENGVNILPVDSEHSAIFQCLTSGRKEDLRRIILTASGGSFFNTSREDMKKVTKASALLHPTWKMGQRITVDSSTMMNKGFEVIEAKHLFDISEDNIEVVIQRESIVHSMVEFKDGSIIAQMSYPSMEIPISLALSYPERCETMGTKMNFNTPFSLNFLPPDYERFPLLKLAYDTLKAGGLASCVMCVADEIAVNKFLKEKIDFLDIEKEIFFALDRINYNKSVTYVNIINIIEEVKALLK